VTSESAAKKRVLVVEDEPDFAELLRWILRKAGYAVEIAYNCENALKQMRKRRPSLITLDIGMPRRSGVFFYRKFKTDGRFRDIPVVVVTALARNDKEMGNIVRSLLETKDVPHPEAYVDKPIDEPYFLRTVRDVLLSAKAGNG
jgi:CheY-like chemotaxis protein